MRPNMWHRLAWVSIGLVALTSCPSKAPDNLDPPPPTTNSCMPGPQDPGFATVRRLNRAEYDNTVRDLLHTDLRPAVAFPADNHANGFDTASEQLSMTPLLFEKMENASRGLADWALGRTTTRVDLTVVEAESLTAEGGQPRDGAFIFYAPTTLRYTMTATTAGRYTITMRAFGDQAGTELPMLEVNFDGVVVSTFSIDAVEASPKSYTVDTALSAGEHTLALTFTNDFIDESANLDRNLGLDWFSIEGPFDAASDPLNPEARARIVTCDPEVDGRVPCASSVLGAFARLAWRRPVTSEEVERLVELSEVALDQGDDFDAQMALGISGILLSPHFVFRVEAEESPDAEQPRSVSDHALAVRLSYFLWSSMPDQPLSDLADAGELSDPTVLAEQINRMLRDERAKALIDNFVGQWLRTRALDDVGPDSATFPSFDQSLREALRAETELFMREFMTTDRNATEMFSADFTYVNDRLAAHYGLPAVGTDEMTRVSVSGQRGGLLTQGSILTVTSHPRRTSPVGRGKWILEELLCDAPPPPPPGVEGIPETVNPNASLRVRFEQHRADPACRPCHALMDPLGFSLEHFDGIGAWRENDNGFEIDPSGVLPDGREFSGHQELATIMKTDLRTTSCLSQKLLTYATGRAMRGVDRCTIQRVADNAVAEDGSFGAYVRQVVMSEPFTQRRGAQEAESP